MDPGRLLTRLLEYCDLQKLILLNLAMGNRSSTPDKIIACASKSSTESFNANSFASQLRGAKGFWKEPGTDFSQQLIISDIHRQMIDCIAKTNWASNTMKGGVQKVQCAKTNLNGCKIVLLDTPGFDDHAPSDIVDQIEIWIRKK